MIDDFLKERIIVKHCFTRNNATKARSNKKY